MSTEPTIEQMNAEIAKFIGGEVREVWRVEKRAQYAWTGEQANKFRNELMGINVGNSILIEQLKFHSSWDWLMPVVKKIKSMHFDLRDSAPIFAYMKAAGPMNSALVGIDLPKLHYGVYQFIQWYNKQKETNNER